MFRRLIGKCRQAARVLNNLDSVLSYAPRWGAFETLVHLQRDQLLATHPRYRDPRCLTPHGYSVYSQFDDDGILARIYALVGPGTRTFVEFGVEDGLETNSGHLLLQGWSGGWIDGNSDYCTRIRTTFAPLLARGRLRLTNAFITTANIQELLAGLGTPADLDLLSIDIDGNDYWVWEAIADVRPRVVVAEYNACFGPTAEWIMPYDAGHQFGGTRYAGASLKSFERLGRQKGYALVGCSFYGTNAFFVRDDLVGDHFLTPATSETHYEPPRYHRASAGGGGWGKDVREVAGYRL